jgi:hypothetical protein
VSRLLWQASLLFGPFLCQRTKSPSIRMRHGSSGILVLTLLPTRTQWGNIPMLPRLLALGPQGQQRGLSSHSLRVSNLLPTQLRGCSGVGPLQSVGSMLHPLTFYLGPFELTKLSAQISVLMADRTPPTSLSEPNRNHAIARSYQNKGTWKTAKNIIKYRGFSGLYSGLSLHLR